ncbi:hypothetical protein MUK42_19815 [Musa troglodytarum]|uniref:Uncharacterized protein n=1 Tax=Musa troglodytarum TaxID=320322 RepID=A0A9E7FV62_9LILI|nr:hypothetical protein MUK42_19815 [Musa troglodytarum]
MQADRVESNAAVITGESTTPTAAGPTNAASSRTRTKRCYRHYLFGVGWGVGDSSYGCWGCRPISCGASERNVPARGCSYSSHKKTFPCH